MAMDSRAFFYLAVLIVVVGNVVFGLDWQSAPMSRMPEIEVMTYAAPPTVPAKTVVPSAALSSNTNVTPNNATTGHATPPTAPAKTVVPNAALSSNTAVTPNNAATDNFAPIAQIPSQSKCDVSACTSAYRSFRESDCTYQPSGGPRRLCTKGVVATEPTGAPDAAATSNTAADANPQSDPLCNVNACAAAYGSFNPSDCTYQPSRGPRRLCAK